MRFLRAVVAIPALSVAVLVTTAPPASAHAVSGVGATDYRSVIVAITPASPGVHVRLLDLGHRIQLTNNGAVEVIVLGYQGEPYLRVGPEGAWQNLHSPAVYENRPVPAGTTAPPLPPIAQPAAPPQWARLDAGRTVTWRDSRTSWRGPRPAAVANDPGRATAASDWAVQLVDGKTPVAVEGRIIWVPRPNPYPWIALTLALGAAIVVAGISRRWGHLLAGALAAVVATDAVRSYATAVVSGGPEWAILVRTGLAGGLGIVSWALGALGVGRLQEERESGALLALFVGLYIAIFSGLTDLPYLLHSQIPVAASPTLGRAGVAIATGGGLGLAIASILRIRRFGGQAAQSPRTGAAGQPVSG